MLCFSCRVMVCNVEAGMEKDRIVMPSPDNHLPRPSQDNKDHQAQDGKQGSDDYSGVTEFQLS